jgi:DNA-binding transcriptional MerR regulator
MRIAELAKRSSTSKETIHFYLREGLLKKPKKTSKNMAYYDESHLEQLKLIKRLRTESYLPLQVIKKVLKQGKLASSTRHLDLAGELFGQGARSEFEPPTQVELAERSVITAARLEAYEKAGLLEPSDGKGARRYGYEDARIAEAIAHAEKDAGEGNQDLLLERLAIIERHMRDLVKEELAHFFGRVLNEGDPGRAIELLRGGRESMGRFLTLSRARRLRLEVEAMLPSLERTIEAQPKEPFYFPVPERIRKNLGEPAHKRALLDAMQARPKDLQAAIVALSHLLYLGDIPELLQHFEAPFLAEHGDLHLRTIHAEALLLTERSPEAHQILSRIRDAGPDTDPLREALWAASVLILIRNNFTETESSSELIGQLTKAFAAFDVARRARGVPPFDRARIQLLLGRVCCAAPEFLGVLPQGRADLEGCLSSIRALRDLEGSKSHHGALERIERNALHVLATAAETPAERATYQAALDALIG